MSQEMQIKLPLLACAVCEIRLYIQEMYIHEITCGHYVPAPLSWGEMSVSVSVG